MSLAWQRLCASLPSSSPLRASTPPFSPTTPGSTCPSTRSSSSPTSLVLWPWRSWGCDDYLQLVMGQVEPSLVYSQSNLQNATPRSHSTILLATLSAHPWTKVLVSMQGCCGLLGWGRAAALPCLALGSGIKWSLVTGDSRHVMSKMNCSLPRHFTVEGFDLQHIAAILKPCSSFFVSHFSFVFVIGCIITL